MRVVFAGTGEFAAICLDTLSRQDIDLIAVITRPDRPQGRSRALLPTPVAARANTLAATLFKIENIRAVEKELEGLDLDLMVVADFGEIIPERVLGLPRRGSFNVHGSLLPRWRGAAPCTAAIRAGDTTTGVTIFRMVKGLDAGPILCRREVEILAADTAGTLEERLAREAGALLAEAIPVLRAGDFSLREQDPRLVTLAPKLRKEDGWIPWSADARAVERHIRAMQPWPGAFSALAHHGQDPLRVNILAARVVAESGPAAEPGTIVAVAPLTLEVACGAGKLGIARLQAAGKKALSVAEFLRGNRVAPGDGFRTE
jgi:methionyl-tRNA formyltransferase